MLRSFDDACFQCKYWGYAQYIFSFHFITLRISIIGEVFSDRPYKLKYIKNTILYQSRLMKKSNTITFDSWCMTCLAWVFLKAFHDVMKERICDVGTTWLSSNEGDAMLHLIRYTIPLFVFPVSTIKAIKNLGSYLGLFWRHFICFLDV